MLKIVRIKKKDKQLFDYKLFFRKTRGKNSTW